MQPMRAEGYEDGPIYRYLTQDHVRLEALLERAVRRLPEVDDAAYAEFRRGLLRHIRLEEKILLPSAERARGGVAHPAAAELRLQHGAIAALLVPPPSPAIVAALRRILARQNALEEGPEGVYAACERALGERAGAVEAELRAAPVPGVNPHVSTPEVLEATRRAVRRAGYDLEG